MPKLINLYHPYEFNKIKSIKDFLVFSKNIFRILQKKGCYEKKDGILIPIRWSKEKENWVVDRGTGLKRDIDGITIENIDMYFKRDEKIYDAIVHILKSVKSNEDINSFAQKTNLLKNSVKFIAFEYVNKNEIYPLGIYQFCETKKRKGIFCSCQSQSKLFDNSLELLKELSSLHESYKFNSKLKFKKSYIDVYNEFLNELKKTCITFDYYENKIEYNFKNLIEENINFKFNIKNLKLYRNIINNKVLNDLSIKNDIVFLYATILLGEFLKKELDLDDAEGVVVLDDMAGDNFKFTGNKVLDDKISFSKDKNVYNKDNNYLLLPRTY